MRLGVYTDYHYWREGDSYYAERAFFTFITQPPAADGPASCCSAA